MLITLQKVGLHFYSRFLGCKGLMVVCWVCFVPRLGMLVVTDGQLLIYKGVENAVNSYYSKIYNEYGDIFIEFKGISL